MINWKSAAISKQPTAGLNLPLKTLCVISKQKKQSTGCPYGVIDRMFTNASVTAGHRPTHTSLTIYVAVLTYIYI